MQAPADAREPLLRAFLDDARAQGDRVVAVQVRREQVELLRRHGLAASQLGSSYALELTGFFLAGGARLKLRNKIARARRAGVVAVELGRDRPFSAAQWRAVEQVSRAWLGAKGAPELDFLVGELGAPDESRRVFVAEQDGRSGLPSPTCPPGGGPAGCTTHAAPAPGTARVMGPQRDRRRALRRRGPASCTSA